jgi:hypothetical protein
MRYECVCGKKHKSQNTVRAHRKKLTANDNQNEAKPQIEAQNNTQIESQSFKKQIITKIDLKGEFENMTEKINPKKDKVSEEKYECGACGGKFNEKYSRCPHCGCEFE